MKKLTLGLFAAGLLVAASSSLYANGTPIPETVGEGVEISGNIIVLAGYQHDDKDAFDGARFGGLADTNNFANSADADHFRFIVDQVELDIAKSFGENIRLRADIDFISDLNTANNGGDIVDLEQAYVTANLAAGNGIEFLIGKFNAPIGVESVDRSDNWLSSYSSVFRFITPDNVTGLKLYYAFNDLIDWHFAIVNDLNGSGISGGTTGIEDGISDSALPSILTRLGFNWGEEGRENTVGLAVAAGPEQGANNAHWDFIVDVDAMIAIGDSLTFATEVAYRQSNNPFGGTLQNQKVFAAFAALNYQLSDVWDLTWRVDWMWDFNNTEISGGASTTSNGILERNNYNGFYEGTQIGGSFGAGYMITDGAKMKLEYRFDFAAVSGPALDSDYHALLMEFDYAF